MSITWRTSNGIESATASSAAEFIEALRPSNQHWWDDQSCPWVFRGHAQEDWPLLPSAWRPNNPIIENCIIEASRRFEIVSPTQTLGWMWKPPALSSLAAFAKNDALARQLTIATTAEYLPIWDFVAKCDELGMPIQLSAVGPDPIQDPNWLADTAFPLVSDDLLQWPSLSEALALAQHHGIPTRLLDWTRNPIVAAFFAVECLREPINGKDLVVWGLHKRRASQVTVAGMNLPNVPGRFDPKIAIVRPSTRDNSFLLAQAGLFTTISLSGIYFLRSDGKRPSLETIVAESNPAAPVLRKLILSHQHAADLIEALGREGVSRSALMPTMDNVARDIRKKWGQRENLS